MSVKEHAKNVDTWLRGLFILVFGVIFYFLYIIIWLLVIFQFFTRLPISFSVRRLKESDCMDKSRSR